MTAQAPQVDFALHTLGWKAFQDLCAELSREILKRPVEVYNPSKDGGRDASFLGRLDASSGQLGPEMSTIQCKFSASANSALRLAQIKTEEPAIKAAVAAKVADGYVLMTNMSVSRPVAASVSQWLKAIGVQYPTVLGREAITSYLVSSARLRALVPRVYGLGDLSWIVDTRRIDQARAVLQRLGEEGLRTYVPTEAHRRAVNALHKYNVALLVGEPASGKSTIAAILAANALDMGSHDVIRVDRPDEFVRHWNPNEKARFFWIDDAFGSNHLRKDFADEWTRLLPELRVACRQSNRLVFTSRDYIWNEAKKMLRFGSLAGLGEGEEGTVTIELSELSLSEKEQILYNHIKLGDQPSIWRKRVAPFLPEAARHSRFLPEIARRLGRSSFTHNLVMSLDGLLDFVRSPKAYLAETINQLPVASQAALALIYVFGGRLASPISDDERLRIVETFLGVKAVEIRNSLDALKESFVLLIKDDDGDAWVYKHPTITDVYSDILSETPEGIDLFVRGARPEDLMGNIVCGDRKIPGDPLKVPARLYEIISWRLAAIPDKREDNYALFNFLDRRCDDSFLATYIGVDKLLTSRRSYNFSDIMSDGRISVLARLTRLGLTTSGVQEELADLLRQKMNSEGDLRFIESADHLAVFTPKELVEIGAYAAALLSRAEHLVDDLRDDSDDEDALRRLDRSLDILETLLPSFDSALESLQEARELVEHALDDVRSRRSDDDDNYHEVDIEPSSPSADVKERSVFDDLHL